METLTATFEEDKFLDRLYPDLATRNFIIPAKHLDHIHSLPTTIGSQDVCVLSSLEVVNRGQPQPPPRYYRIDDLDTVHRKVHWCLNKVRKQLTSQETMVVMSQISFRIMYKSPVSELAALSLQTESAATNAEEIPENENLLKQIFEQKEKFSDILVVNQKRGLLVGVVESVHFNDPSLAKEKLKESAAYLTKAATIVLETVKAVPGADNVAVRTTLVVPNITRKQLDKHLKKVVQNVTCLCLDEMDTDEGLKLWWEACWSPPQQDVIDSKVYRNLFTKFVIPAVNVDTYLTTQPCPQLKHPHDLVNAVGDIHGTEVFQAGAKQLSLFPSQERLLDLDLVDDNRDDVKLLWGPPGTGKTVLLELRALQWVKHFSARHIVILQTRQDGTAASCLVEYQLQQTLNAQQQLARQSGADTQSAQCTFTHVNLSGLCRLETSSKAGEKEVLKEEGRQILRQKFFHYKQWTSSDAIHIVADEANGNITAAVYQWLKDVGVVIVRLWAAGVELFVDLENIPVSLQHAVCHVTKPLRCPGPVVQQVMGARQIVEGKVPGYDVGWLLTSLPLVTVLPHDHNGHDGHSKGDSPWRCGMCSMNIVTTLKGLLVGEGDEGRPGLSANDVFILSSRMSCDKPDDDVLSPAPLIKTLTDNGYRVRTLSPTSGWDDIMSVIRPEAKSPAITVANERCVLGLEKKVVLYCDTAANAVLSGKLLAFSRTTSLLIFVSSDECITDSKLPRTRDHLDIDHLDKMTDRRCMPNWRTREEKDEMDGWTSLHLACYNNRLDTVRSLVKPRSPDLTRPGDVFSEKPAANAKVDSPKQGTFAEEAGISSTDPGAPVTESKDVTEGSLAHSSAGPVTIQENSSPTQRVSRIIPIQYGYWPNDIDVETEDGETPLFIASSRGHAEIVKYLLQRGADAKIKNKDGKSPKDIAAQQGHTVVVGLLSSHKQQGASTRLT